MTPSNGEDKHLYIKDLVLRMMKADARRDLSGLVRINPIINAASTDPVSTRAKAATGYCYWVTSDTSS
jgi:hypothetical protein